MSRCAYTLYSPGFDDQRFWQTALGHSTGEQSVEARYGALSAAPLQAAFNEVALFTAWHTAASHRMAARFLFGMRDEMATILSRAPLWQVRCVAIDYPCLLTPRWPLNPAFWPDLIRFAAAGDAVKLEAAHLLGSQLITAEIQGEVPLRPRSRLRVHRSKP
ncbi:MAG TPA: hypothetical protein VIT67_00695 [Povalibacter sp.]